jgi:hypothetical protein
LGSDKRDEYQEALRYDSPGSPSYDSYYYQTLVDAQHESSPLDSGALPESYPVDSGAQPESSPVDSGAQPESRKREGAPSPLARPGKRVRFNANLKVQEIPCNTVPKDILMIDVSDTIN